MGDYRFKVGNLEKSKVGDDTKFDENPSMMWNYNQDHAIASSMLWNSVKLKIYENRWHEILGEFYVNISPENIRYSHHGILNYQNKALGLSK